eukprot:1915001-Karenia_brevis.AAC.1
MGPLGDILFTGMTMEAPQDRLNLVQSYSGTLASAPLPYPNALPIDIAAQAETPYGSVSGRGLSEPMLGVDWAPPGTHPFAAPAETPFDQASGRRLFEPMQERGAPPTTSDEQLGLLLAQRQQFVTQ